MPKLEGKTLNKRYRVVEFIDRGGMSEIYKALDTRRGHHVALKVMRNDLALDREFVRRFKIEADALSALSHDNIVRFYSFEQHERLAFIVMGYVQGSTLGERIFDADQRPIPLQEVLPIARQVCAALHYAHQEGILHRDVKPSNILIEPSGQVQVTDFGIAKVTSSATITSFLLGTPAYMSPEQCGRERPDARTDVYALGIVLFEMLAGRRPFVGDGARDQVGNVAERICWEQRNAPPPPLRDFDPHLSPKVEQVVLKALSKVPGDRWSTPLDLWQALESTARTAEDRTPISLEGPVIGDPDATVLHEPHIDRQASTIIHDEQRPVPVASQPGIEPPTPTLPVLADVPVPQPDVAISPGNAASVQELARWGKGWISQVAFAPGGVRLLVASSVGVYLHDAHTLEEIPFLAPGSGLVSAAFGPKERLVATVSHDDTVSLWRTGDGRLVRTFQGHEGGASCVAFALGGQVLVAGSHHDAIRLWRVEDGQLLYTLDKPFHRADSIAVSHDGQIIASASQDKTVCLWQARNGRLLRTLDGHPAWVLSVAFSPDGKLLASGSADGRVRLWGGQDGDLVHTLTGHQRSVRGLAFSPDGETLASASDDGTVRLWRVAQGLPSNTLKGHKAPVNTVAYAPDGRTLVTGSRDGALRLWRARDGHELHTRPVYSDSVYSLALDPDGQTLTAWGQDSRANLWRLADGHLLEATKEPYPEVSFIKMSPNGKILARASDETVRLHRERDHKVLHTLEAHTGLIEGIAFDPRSEILASASIDKTVCLWQVGTGRLLRSLDHTDWVSSVAFSPDGHLVASASYDKTVRLWRTSDGQLLHTLQGHAEWVHSVLFTPDGKFLASGSEDGTVRLWGVHGD